MHMEGLPVSLLSLLPLSTRKELLPRMPIADVCLLEDTMFVDGIDMEAYWKALLKPGHVGESPNSFCFMRGIRNRVIKAQDFKLSP